MSNKGTVTTNDLLVNRIERAFNGLGGAGCNYTTGTPGVGNCKYLNPFSNGIAKSGITGATNPFYVAAVANDPQLVKWLYGTYTDVTTNEIFVADAVFNGETPITLPGGNVAWAAGAQYRYLHTLDDWSPLGNVDATPCVDSIDGQQGSCPNPVGPFVFFGAQHNADVHQRVAAGFGEVRIPVLDKLEFTAAVRYEDFGGNVGSTTNPKVSARWQALDWLALRASAGSTFRAPSPLIVSPGSSKGVSNIGGSYRAVVTANNPNLQPETADTYNIGILVDYKGFTASIDYFRFDFQDELGVEDTTALYNSLDCSKPALVARFVFTAAGCGKANVLQLTREWVNGPRTRTTGYDFKAQYDFDNFFGMDLYGTKVSIGLDGTLLNDFKRGAATLPEDRSVVFAAPIDRAGLHDLGGGDFFSYPKLRANGFINVKADNWNLRYQLLYREGTTNVGPTCLGDASAGLTADCQYNYATGVYQSVGKTDDYWQHDITLTVNLPGDTVLSGSIQNILDTDPPFAESFYNYDLTNGNPLGRVFKLGVKKKF